MKISLLILLTFFLTQITLGQTFVFQNNPTFDSVKVIPSNPSSNDSVKLIIFVSNEIEGRSFITGGVTDSICNYRNNDTIGVSVASLEYTQYTTYYFVDKISIGIMNSNQYVVLLTNHVSHIVSDFPPSSITYHTDSVAFALSVISSLPDNKSNIDYLDVYPNPNNEKIFVTLKTNDKYIKNINLFDLTGKQILEKNNTTHKKTIEVSMKNIKTGIYFLRIITNDRSEFFQKIVKL